MKKLAGLLAFAVALVGAIMLTQYYTRRYAPPPPPAPPAAPAAPVPPATGVGVTTVGPSSSVYTDARGNAPVNFKVQLATLDPAAGKGRLTLLLERDPARPAGANVWVWAYFFSPDAPGRYCAGEPVEVGQALAPSAGGARAEVKIEMALGDCPAPRTPSSTYYARVNVSTESAFAARLSEQSISYDVSQASPVVVEGKR